MNVNVSSVNVRGCQNQPSKRGKVAKLGVSLFQAKHRRNSGERKQREKNKGFKLKIRINLYVVRLNVLDLAFGTNQITVAV